MPGWLGNGVVNWPNSSFTGAEVLTLDTETAAGVSPQTATVTLSQLSFGPTTTGITAHAGGGQAAATVMGTGYNSVDTVATAADSVALPLATFIGQRITVMNTAANAMQVFGSGTDTVNYTATATGVSQASHILATYTATKLGPAGNWNRIISS